MRYSAVICTLVVIAVAGMAEAAKRPPIPEICRPTGACQAPAPACSPDGTTALFVCEQSTGTWVGIPNTGNETWIYADMTIGGPVRIDGNFSLVSGANLTFNESSTAFLTVNGFANFTQANETWYIRIGEEDLKVMAESESSANYTGFARRVFKSHDHAISSGWKLKLSQTSNCHVPSLIDDQPAWGPLIEADGPWDSFVFYTKTKSECWWWIVLVGVILIYFALLFVLIILFRTVPALKRWTARPAFEAHGPSAPIRLADNEYEMEYSDSNKFSQPNHEDEETDSVRLDL